MQSKINLKEYYIAYIDILGYKSLFSENNEENNALVENIIFAFNKINNSINQTNNSPFLQLVNMHIEKRMFSDNIVFCLPVTNESYEILRLLGFLNQICDFQKGLCLEHKIFIRGAIVKDKIYLSEHSIQGPGIINAATLEEKIAVYPRVIVDKSIEKSINVTSQNNDSVTQWLKKIVKFFPDNILFLNYLYEPSSLLEVVPALQNKKNQIALLKQLENISPVDSDNILSSINNFPSIKEMLEQHRNIILEKINQFSNYENEIESSGAIAKEKIIKKYHWTLTYHNFLCKIYNEIDYEIKFGVIIDYRFGTMKIILAN